MGTKRNPGPRDCYARAETGQVLSRAISVDERLPRHSDRVLIWSPVSGWEMARCVDGYFYTDLISLRVRAAPEFWAEAPENPYTPRKD